MIKLYSGTPGSGKSFHLISDILQALSRGKYVIANFAITFTPKEKKKGYEERFYYWDNDYITVERLLRFYFIKKLTKEGQCLVVIDEAGGRFNCREYGKSDRAVWLDFFRQHRKAGFNFILVSQNDRVLDRQIRHCIEKEYVHRKCNNFGPFWLIPWPVFIVIEYWYGARAREGSQFLLYKPSLGKRYDTMKMFTGLLTTEAAQEAQDKPGGIFNVPISAIFESEATA